MLTLQLPLFLGLLMFPAAEEYLTGVLERLLAPPFLGVEGIPEVLVIADVEFADVEAAAFAEAVWGVDVSLYN
jgi:hypothetical protein